VHTKKRHAHRKWMVGAKKNSFLNISVEILTIHFFEKKRHLIVLIHSFFLIKILCLLKQLSNLLC
jgi:hypothetical protein